MYKRLEPVLVAGIQDNLKRDHTVTTAHPTVMEKLGHTSPMEVDDRVSICLVRSGATCLLPAGQFPEMVVLGTVINLPLPTIGNCLKKQKSLYKLKVL